MSCAGWDLFRLIQSVVLSSHLFIIYERHWRRNIGGIRGEKWVVLGRGCHHGVHGCIALDCHGALGAKSQEPTVF